ncbi:MAG: hypothetical protein ABSD73_08875 [Candidatus Bathyarchaeia archaeon]
MSFRDRLRNLKEDAQRLEREKEEKVVQEIEKKNQAIRQYSRTIKKVCNEFCKGVGYKLKIYEFNYKREDLRFWKNKENSWTADLGPGETSIIPLDIHADFIRIWPHSETSKFDEIRLSFADFSEERLAESLETAYKQENGLAPRAPGTIIRPPPPPWRDQVALKAGEYIVKTANEGEGDLFYSGECIYVLTNQRLAVLKREFFAKKDGSMPNALDFALQLSEVKSIKPEREFALQSIQDFAINGSDNVYVYADNVKYTYDGGSSIKKDFRDKIILQKEKKSIVLDFSSLRSLMEKGGMVLTTLRCPHCNGPVNMPSEGNETGCDHCGTKIYAQDIFKKIKELTS